nr:hypothetical protein [Tanacetum cinerariifolium]
MMMVLVRQTENYDMLLHMVMTDIKLLVVEIETADITADDVDKVSCSTDVERSKQVDLKFAHSTIELHLHDIHVDQDKHEVDRQEILQDDQSFEPFSLDNTTWICLSKEVVQLR